MDGSKERGVFVLSRELYSFLSIFINNSAHGQGGGVEGTGAVGDSSIGDQAR